MDERTEKMTGDRLENIEEIGQRSDQDCLEQVLLPDGGWGQDCLEPVLLPDGGWGQDCLEPVLLPDGGWGQDCLEPVLLRDGGWGWMVVVASFLANLVTNGIAYSLGIFYVEFLEFYKSGKGETAWLGSLVPGLTLLFGILAGPLVDMFGCRITTFAGAIIAATGFVLSVFAPNIYFLYFSFGVLPGLGFGLIYLPAIVIVGHYFERKRTFAVGLATSGSGIGAFIFNPFTKFLIDSYGWRGAILIEAGIVLNCAVFGAFFRPLTPLVSRKDKTEEASTEDFDDPYESCSLKMDTVYLEETQIAQSRSSGVINTKNPVKCEDQDKICSTLKAKKRRSQRKGGKTAGKKSFLGKMCITYITFSFTQLGDCSRLKNSVFIIYVFSNILSSLGLIIPPIFLYDYAVEQNIGEDRAKWLGSIIGITNTFGRGICGLVADRPNVNKLVLFSIALIVSGISIALCSLHSTFALLVAFSCLFGLSYGIYVPLLSVVLVDLLGIHMLNGSFGVLLLFKGAACLIGPPCAGWLFDATRSYNLSFLVAGVTVVISGIILILTPMLQKCHKEKNSGQNANEKEQLKENINI